MVKGLKGFIIKVIIIFFVLESNALVEKGEKSVYAAGVQGLNCQYGSAKADTLSFSKIKSLSLDTSFEKNMVSKFCDYFYNNFSETDCNVFLADVTHDGCKDMIVVDLSNVESEQKIDVYIYIYSNQKVKNIKKITGYEFHAGGFLNLYLLDINSKCYLYQCSDHMWQGYGSLEYKIFSLSKTGKEMIHTQNKAEGEPITDKSCDDFTKEEVSYGKYLVSVLYGDSPYFGENYTVSRAGDVFKGYIKPVSDAIQLKDLTIERSIRKILGKTNGAISKKDLAKIKKLKISDEQIVSLEDLNYCTNLTDLSLSACQITNISCLKNLSKLKSLDLCYNKIGDISVLKEMSNLSTLYLLGCDISDISSLKNLKKLTLINLDHNDINSIDALKGLTNLTYLSLHACNIRDIKALKKLTKLKSLDLGGNSIKDISSICGLVNLNTVYLNSNEITDMAVLKNLKKLRFLDLGNNHIKNIKSLHGLTKLTYLDVSENKVTDWTPVNHVAKVIGRPK